MKIEKIKSLTELTVFHFRAARAILKLSFKELSMISTISERALIKLEVGDLSLPPKHSSIVTIGRMKATYESLDIQFYKNNFIHILSSEEKFKIRFVNK